MIVLAPRAAAILYRLLRSRPDRRPFLMPANICPVVPLAFLKAGVPYEFVDISPHTLNMDLDQAAQRLRTGGFGGVLYAHTYGDPSTPADFFAAARYSDPSLLVIDDRCLCPPDGEPDPVNPADVLLYSTGYAKMVDFGSGGYAFVRDGIACPPDSLPFNPADLEEVEKAYKVSIATCQPFSYRENDWLETDGEPARWEAYWDKITAALGPSLAHRREINAVYTARLPGEIQLPERYQTWRFHIRLTGRQRGLDALFAAGLFASAHYASLAGIFAPGDCPQAAELAGQIVNLFNDHHYTAAMAERTCEIIRKVL